MRIRLVLTLLLALVAGTLPASAAAAGPATLRALTFNVCGNVCRNGEVAATAGNIAFKVRTLRPAVTMLQELCFSQYLAIRDRLAPYGYAATFGTASRGGHCDDYDRSHGTAFGIAIIVRGTLTDTIAHRMPSPDRRQTEGRVVLAATARTAGRTMLVVTTHTAHTGPDRIAQIAALQRWLTPYAVSGPVLFGGDLNLTPDNPALDGFYDAFGEANGTRTGPLATFVPYPSRKIDYLFGSERYLHPAAAARVCTDYSDHCVYVGTFR
jgi:endonuclease/exonuclease/phosphatase family metal-dependent hydrolase